MLSRLSTAGGKDEILLKLVRTETGEVLAVSQFTLAGSIARGRRPSFEAAMEPVRARQLFERFVAALAAAGATVHTGAFGEHMEVLLVNDGPVTFVYDTSARRAMERADAEPAP